MHNIALVSPTRYKRSEKFSENIIQIHENLQKLNFFQIKVKRRQEKIQIYQFGNYRGDKIEMYRKYDELQTLTSIVFALLLFMIGYTNGYFVKRQEGIFIMSHFCFFLLVQCPGDFIKEYFLDQNTKNKT